jgi:hypothetical protein
MDNRQYNFDLSLDQLGSTEFADFETVLSEHLSSGFYYGIVYYESIYYMTVPIE